MLKRIQYLGLSLSLSLFLGCASTDPQDAGVDISSQWPMSGGPNGTWKVETSSQVPTHWSVRTGENIKWKAPLPAGGQSGIAVWGDRLFLTINPPKDTPPYAELETRAAAYRTQYEALYAATVDRLRAAKDLGWSTAVEAQVVAANEWAQFLTDDAQYQKTPAYQQAKARTALLRKSVEGRALTAADRALLESVHGSADGLSELYRNMLETERLMASGASSKDVVLYCMNALTGETLWNRTVAGEWMSGYNYGFSDATTPCPMTDGEYVWAINASGGMACFTMEGEPVWSRTWMPTSGRPFNKQFDSILYGDWILNSEPPLPQDTHLNPEWNYLHAFNKHTGERVWVTYAALTHYNTPILGTTAAGQAAVMIGRGGPHGVPERPVGLSLISLEADSAGTALWHWEPEDSNAISGWGALSTQHWDADTVSWFNKREHLTVDAQTGQSLGRHALFTMDQHAFDTATGRYVLTKNVSPPKIENQRHCNLLVGDDVFYLVRYAPYVARHNVKTGHNEMVEVPCELDANGAPIWGQPQSNDGLNSLGQRHGADGRTRGDGFQKCFLGSPTMINDYIYFTNALGMVYVIDSKAETFDERAIVAVNDLGARGETLTYNSLSFANGHIYHRTLKEIICIGE